MKGALMINPLDLDAAKLLLDRLRVHKDHWALGVLSSREFEKILTHILG